MNWLSSVSFWIKWYIGLILYALLLLFYAPFYVVMSALVLQKLWILKMRKRFGFGYRKFGELGLASRKSRVSDVVSVSTENDIDFLQHRTMGYLRRLCFRMPWEIANMILRQEQIPLISDEQLAYVLLNTAIAQAVCWDGQRGMFRLDMAGLEHYILFQGFFWDARQILISPDCKRLIICMNDGNEYRSDCDKKHRPTFDLAKLHLQICLTFFGPGMSHNHVHFVFPSSIAVLSQRLLNRNGTLYKLLYQHFRFTEAINYQALRVQKSTNNKRSIIDRLFFFWQPIPITKEQFAEGIAKKCKEYYVEKSLQDLEIEQPVTNSEKRLGHDSNGGFPAPNGNAHSSSVTGNNYNEPNLRTHNLFPPEFVTDKSRQRIPYLKFLAQYYEVIRDFVESLAPFIDKDEWKTLSNQVAKHVPRFDECNMVDAIATFIHQVGVIHYCDHSSFYRYFASRYGCMGIRVPFEPFEKLEEWIRFEDQYRIDIKKTKKNPLTIIRQRDVMRTRSFLDLFVDYIPSSTINLGLINTEYNFHSKAANIAAENFKTKLRSLDGNLKFRVKLYMDLAAAS